jgi:hypothetical protein
MSLGERRLIKSFGDVKCNEIKLRSMCCTDQKWHHLAKRYPCYRPWRPLGLRGVKAPTLLRETDNRWRQGCQPYALAALYLQVSLLRFLVLISVRGWVDPRATVRLEGLGKFKKIHLIGMWSRDLPACGIVPQPPCYHVPRHHLDESETIFI